LFAGYDRVVWGRRIWERIRTLPRPLRSLAAAVLEAVPPGAAAWAARAMLSPRPGGRDLPDLAVKLRKLASILPSESADAMYFDLVSAWKQPARLVTGTEEGFDLRRDRPVPDGFTDATERMLYWDMVTALPDQMLVKVDRASMAASLEVRVPLLDHRLVEFAWSLPLDLKIRENRGKCILRQVLDRYVPRALVDRPKTGFRVPLGEWLRGPMRDWAEALLAENRLRSEGFFDPALIRVRWADHLRGRPADVTPLWSVLMFEAWLEAARAGRI
jgi:asparagine synthase (glutamine-hydrolysing)